MKEAHRVLTLSNWSKYQQDTTVYIVPVVLLCVQEIPLHSVVQHFDIDF